ncbi:MAG: hypothetical protein AAFY41_03825 [Bacteroidota bacterium]
MRIIRINKGRTISLPIRLLGVFGILMLITTAMINLSEAWAILVSIILASFFPALWFSFNVIIIDAENQEVFEGVWTMGKRFGKPVPFNKIEKIFINKVKTRQTIYSLSSKQNIVANHEFRAYLKLDNEEEYFLISHPIKERAQDKVSEIKRKLCID